MTYRDRVDQLTRWIRDAASTDFVELPAVQALAEDADAEIIKVDKLLKHRWGIIERLTKQHNEWKASTEQTRAQLAEKDRQIAALKSQMAQSLQHPQQEVE